MQTIKTELLIGVYRPGRGEKYYPRVCFQDAAGMSIPLAELKNTIIVYIETRIQKILDDYTHPETVIICGVKTFGPYYTLPVELVDRGTPRVLAEKYLEKLELIYNDLRFLKVIEESFAQFLRFRFTHGHMKIKIYVWTNPELNHRPLTPDEVENMKDLLEVLEAYYLNFAQFQTDIRALLLNRA